jgi:hypothetical protein
MSAVDVGVVVRLGVAAAERSAVASEREARRRARRPYWEGLALSASLWTGLPYTAFLEAVADPAAAGH